MARNKLSAQHIKNARPGHNPQAEQPACDPLQVFKLSDGGGLYLVVRPSGVKVWQWRYRLGGIENTYTVGEHGDRPGQYTLEAARAERDRARALVKQGKSPVHEKRAQVAATIAEGENTFKAASLDWMAENKGHWSPYYLKQVERGMREDIWPGIGALPIRDVNSAHCLKIVAAVRDRGAATVALNVQQWMGAVFNFAVRNLRAVGDPTDAIKGAVKRPPVKHHAPLTLKELPAFTKALGAYKGDRQTVIALRLLLLTFVRPSELREATWTEFDLDGALWTIPAERMKMRTVHLVPLSTEAVELLRELHTINGGRDLLFPNRRDLRKPMTPTTFNRALERMGYGGKFSAHGFRATASTALHGMAFPSMIVEKQLAHGDRNRSRASYNHAEYLAERRAMMDTWANVVNAQGDGAKVVAIKAA